MEEVLDFVSMKSATIISRKQFHYLHLAGDVFRSSRLSLNGQMLCTTSLGSRLPLGKMKN
jgi:hypothetical protein